MISIDKLTYYYEKDSILNALCLEWNEGETIILSGQSGVGKSTLARMIAGFEKPYSGTIEIDGRLVSSKHSMIPPYDRTVGMVFQGSTLWPHMNVRRNIEFVIPGYRTAECKDWIETMMERAGISDLSLVYPNHLSGGQMRRVEIVRALAARSRYLIMDEPFNHLDSDSRDQMISLVKQEVLSARSGLLLITHSQNVISSFPGRVLCMENGKVMEIHQRSQK